MTLPWPRPSAACCSAAANDAALARPAIRVGASRCDELGSRSRRCTSCGLAQPSVQRSSGWRDCSCSVAASRARVDFGRRELPTASCSPLALRDQTASVGARAARCARVRPASFRWRRCESRLKPSQRSCQSCIDASASPARRREAAPLARRVEARPSSARARIAQLVDLRWSREVQVRLGGALLRLLQLLRCRCAQLARVLDGLLGARDLGADLVVAPLHPFSASAAR